VAVGEFKDVNGNEESFTVTETNGVWGDGVRTTFAAGVQNTSPNSYFYSVACPSNGNCVAVGEFNDANGNLEAFTATETNGVWGDGMPTTFAAGVQDTIPYSYFYSVACPSDGNCVAVGQFRDANRNYEAFTATETNGVWGDGMRTTFAAGVQNTSPYSYFYSVACPSDGNCVAVGSFKDVNGYYEAFTATETNGVWGDGVRTTFAAGVQNTSPYSYFYSVACPSDGNCVAVGEFYDANGNNGSFTATETGGVWGNGVPTTFAAGVQNTSPNDYFSSVACPSDGNCVAVGEFYDAAGNYEAFTLGVAVTFALVAQAALSVVSTSGTVGTALTLATSGGSGTGALSYSVVNGTATGCTNTSGTLIATSAGTCLVTATKAADADYASASSVQTTVTFSLAAQAALVVNSTSATYPYSLALTTTGGSGTGALSYSVVNGTATGCTNTSGTLIATSAGTCLVTATKAADADYASASSVQTTVTFTGSPPPPFAQFAQAVLTLTSTSGTYGSALTLTSSGGSGTGAMSYAVTSAGTAGCSISAGMLSATSAGSCTVTVTKAADTNYVVASSLATTVTFAQAAQAALTLTSTSATFPSSLTLTSSGGSGTGAVSYAVTASGSAGCSISAGTLSATSAGSCTVTVNKAADTNYLMASSPATTVTFAQAAQAALTLTSTSATFPSSLTLTSSGGSGTGAMSYAVTSAGTAGCSISAGMLSATSAGSCTVTVNKAADTNYLVASSPDTTVTFRAKVVPVRLHAIRVNGFVWVGRTVTVTIVGTGFYAQPRITSNEVGTRAVVSHDDGRRLVVRVRLLAGAARGWHTFTITLANGHSCKVNYLVK
jgi:ribosomal protein S27E